jgi:hypothetical protein
MLTSEISPVTYKKPAKLSLVGISDMVQPEQKMYLRYDENVMEREYCYKGHKVLMVP